MEKLIKFNNISEYETFKNNNELTYPRVDYTADNKTCYVNGSAVKLISFKINNVQLTAEEDMTWAEYCESEYNTYGFELDGTYILICSKDCKEPNAWGENYIGKYVANSNDSRTDKDEIIIPNNTYTVDEEFENVLGTVECDCGEEFN